ncbi:MAG: L,D-transpeptidase [Notoacmeibacter sp.]|nr:L,D-transpeptidase [Notoacmeibacter sp.]
MPGKARMLLAQAQPEVYVTPDGARVYVDPYTGDVIGVERLTRRELRHLRNRGYYPRDAWDEREDNRGGFRDVPEERLDEAYPGNRTGGYDRRNDPRDDREEMRPEPKRVERTPLPEPAPKRAAPEREAPVKTATREAEPGERAQPAPPPKPEPIARAEEPPRPEQRGPLIAKVQVLLDRAGASPGAIDGVKGSNMANALASWAEITGKPLDLSDEKAIDAALAARGGPAFVDYTITNEDAAGPYVASVPADYSEKAKLEKMAFTSPAEAIAEKFHMDEAYLKSLNAGKTFNQPGTVIKVANPGMRVLTPVARIVADKGRELVSAYDQQGNLVAAYPATIGSSDTPSPSGTVKVERVAFNPDYTYNPSKNFKQGENDKVLTIPPGPNGPVGTIWIALSKPTYGIHGTPEPSKIGKTNSHGCVRLTNWDAEELARLVKKDVFVQFLD